MGIDTQPQARPRCLGTLKHVNSFMIANSQISSMLTLSAAEAIVDVQDAAEYAGLTYVSDRKPVIRRRRYGKGFRYESNDGIRIKDSPTLKRIKALAVPP